MEVDGEQLKMEKLVRVIKKTKGRQNQRRQNQRARYVIYVLAQQQTETALKQRVVTHHVKIVYERGANSNQRVPSVGDV
jgi:hypothetical protein